MFLNSMVHPFKYLLQIYVKFSLNWCLDFILMLRSTCIARGHNTSPHVVMVVKLRTKLFTELEKGIATFRDFIILNILASLLKFRSIFGNDIHPPAPLILANYVLWIIWFRIDAPESLGGRFPKDGNCFCGARIWKSPICLIWKQGGAKSRQGEPPIDN